jgi:hypothetical protein
MPILSVTELGTKGVIVDLNPLEMDPQALLSAQNVISDPASGQSSIRKRPGWRGFTTTPTAGTVLGGIDLPLLDTLTGTHFLYIGRGPLT